MFRKQLILPQDPGITYPIYDLGLSFNDYASQCRQIIAHNRQDLQNQSDLKINANCPFEFAADSPLKPHKKRYGALLIHGLFDSPFVMRDIGKKLSANGLLVRSVLLPGHGTVPGALLNVNHEDWLQTVRYGISTFKNEVDQIFLVGFSIGGALSVYQTLQSPSDFIAGLVLLAPAFQIKSKFAFMSEGAVWAGKIIERAKWLDIQKETDYVKYQSFAFNAVAEAYRLLENINTYNKNSNDHPLFMALSMNDKTVESQAGINYFSRSNNAKNKLVVYADKNPLLNDSRATLRSSSYPSERIKNISHIAIPIASTNLHYGNQGDYPLASHTSIQSHFYYDEVNPAEISFDSFLYRLNLTKNLCQRLTFNPDFEFLAQSMMQFINSIVYD